MSTVIFKITFFLGVLLLLLQETHYILIPIIWIMFPFVIAFIALVFPLIIGLAVVLFVTSLGKNKKQKESDV